MTTARAALLHGPGEPLTIEEVEVDQLRDDEVLIKVVGVGVCHTDLVGQEGVVPLPYPSVLGHEASGVVAEIGSAVTSLRVGDPVVVSFASCGECDMCLGGRPAYCDLFAPLNYFGSRLDGSVTLHQGEDEVYGSFFGQSSFATHVLTSARNAVRVPDDLPLDIAGPLGCGFLTGAGTVFNVLKVQPGSTLAVFGVGAVGLASVMAAAVAGAETIIAIDISADRLELAKELGATHTIDASQVDDVVWAVMEVVPVGVHASIDAVGHESVIRNALESLRATGTCATVGLQGLENEVSVNQGHLLIGRTLTGVIEGDADPQVLIPRLAELFAEGRFPFDRLVKKYAFLDLDRALADTRDGRVIKPVLVMP
ncbi:MAG: NAD(P)-dependent alcohol dehydrogenase [Actinomycetes bacterium]